MISVHTTLFNSEYNNLASELKNCYLFFNSDYNESCLYGSEVEHSKDCVDNTMIDACELCYQGANLINCYKTKYSLDCEGCRDVWFSKNCANCSNCVGCVNLRNQKYHIFNQPYSKGEYENKVKEYGLDSRSEIEKLRFETRKFYLKFPNKYIHGSNITNVFGDYINNSKNVRNTYIATESQDCRYCMWFLVKPNKDCYDYTQFGDNAERIYDSVVCGSGASDIKFSYSCIDNVSRVSYSEFCYNVSDLFSCSFMQRGRQYCILNKQYSKEDYESLLPKIIKHLDEMPYTDNKGRVYRYGEFASPEIFVFGYNETVAQDFFQKTKKEIEEAGYNWREEVGKEHWPTLNYDVIPDNASDISEDIAKEVLGCAHEGECKEQCTKVFRVTPQEVQFYRRLNLPLLNLCPNCRSSKRIGMRNSLGLWSRNCQCFGDESENGVYKNTAKHPHHGAGKCPNNFETSYSPDGGDLVYCKECCESEVM